MVSEKKVIFLFTLNPTTFPKSPELIATCSLDWGCDSLVLSWFVGRSA